MKRQLLPSNVRNLLGIRKRRALQPKGPKPSPDARICSGDLRLAVQAGMSDALWAWLSTLGWREITFHPDRRRYQDIPEAWVRLLYEAPPERREKVLLQATEAARKRTPHPHAYGEAVLKRQSHRLMQLKTSGE
jgi:hypothetical protein